VVEFPGFNFFIFKFREHCYNSTVEYGGKNMVMGKGDNDMKKINVAGIPAEKGTLPRVRHRRTSQEISPAAWLKNGLVGAGPEQPFAVELVRLPPRALNWPYHSRSVRWELYLIVSGRGQVRTPAGLTQIREGDCLVRPPGEAHQFTNTGATDLVYYVIAENPPSDVCHYPETSKWVMPTPGREHRTSNA
jgi:uncharacterized cupin superfamily protein